MVKNICDLGYAAEEQYRRNSELMRRMLEAKEGVINFGFFITVEKVLLDNEGVSFCIRKSQQVITRYKERTEQQLEEERQRRIAEGGIIWPVWSWITSGSQPGDATSGRAFSVVSDKIKATVFFIVI